jgi:predicted Zn-dependent protease
MGASAAEPVGTLEVALAHAARLLDSNPAQAAEQAAEILAVAANHPIARLVLGTARQRVGDAAGALHVLEPLAREQPNAAAVHLALGIAQSEVGRVADGIASLRRVLRLNPELPTAWRLLADCHDAVGQPAEADQARARFIRSANQDPRLMEAAGALCSNELATAERLLRAHLLQQPTDVAALRMLAEVAARLRRYADAHVLLEHCLELAPSFDAARHNFAVVLYRQGKSAAALPEIQKLLAKEPRNPGYRSLAAAILAGIGEYAESIHVYEAVLKEFPHQSRIWMSYGHSLRTAGRGGECVAAYKRAIALEPTLGEAYWSLANLKTTRFSDAEVETMRTALARNDLSDDNRLHFEFAIGKALEDKSLFDESFGHYERGSAIRRKRHTYRAEETSAFVRRSKALYAREFFAARAGAGAAAADPIFIVGLPRAGSTLLEQILASHSLVDGTMELPDIPTISMELEEREQPGSAGRYPEIMASQTADELRALGERYLASTRIHRKTARPFFVDKMPNNWQHIGLIELILPNAKIIDARRHPLACCFSAFKQHFARGQSFSYSLEDLGRYYRDYVEYMAHIDTVLPSRVHRVYYERTIEDTETVVRDLLAYCGLPYEEGCLRFYENDRAVRTASSEQVRRPIFREGVDHFRNYEPWLGPLKEALGPVLDLYPAIPDFSACLSSIDCERLQMYVGEIST